MRKPPENLVNLAKNTIEPMGYELVGIEYAARPRAGSVLRVYIDSDAGILLDDCAAVSRQLSAVLDVEDPIADQYDLEVSSPGLDRPLFELAHFARFTGSEARVRLSRSRNGRRNFRGRLAGVADELISLDTQDGLVQLSIDDIESARLIPEFKQ